MYLVILNGAVIGTYKDEPPDIPDGAELAEWDGASPEPRFEEVGGIRVPFMPLDPRDQPQKLISAKRRKLKEINAWDEAVRLAGVAVGPYMLRYDDKGQQRITALVSQARELLEQGVITLNSLVTFEDASGNLHKVKVSVIRAAVQTYFTACQAQEEAVGDLLQAVKAATTIEEVNNIVVG